MKGIITLMKKYIEECFLEAGTNRMSKYFGDELFCGGPSAKEILWDGDKCYYKVSQINENEFDILYCFDMMGDYKTIAHISSNVSKKDIRERVKDIVEGWRPEEEMILQKYIDIYAKTPLPYAIKGIFIKSKETKTFVFKQVLDCVIEYEFGLNGEMDKHYELFNYYLKENNYYSAVEVLNELIHLSCKELGEKHNNTLACIYMLRDFAEELLSIEDQLKANLVLYQFLKNVHGNLHITTINSIANIADVLLEMEKYKDAVLLAKFVQKYIKKRYGEFSLENVDALSCLMRFCFHSGATGKALGYAEECLKITRNNFPEYIYWFNRYLGIIYRKMKDYEKALQYDFEVYKELIDIVKQELLDKDDLLESMDALALDYTLLEQYEDVKRIQGKLVDYSIEYYGVNHPKTLDFMSNLSTVLAELEEYEEALKISKYVYEELHKMYGDFHRDTMNAKDNLIIDYININQRELAMEMAEEEYLARLEELGADDEETIFVMQQFDALKR